MELIDTPNPNAKKIEIIHPTYNSKMSFSAPLPNEFIQVINVLKND